MRCSYKTLTAVPQPRTKLTYDWLAGACDRATDNEHWSLNGDSSTPIRLVPKLQPLLQEALESRRRQLQLKEQELLERERQLKQLAEQAAPPEPRAPPVESRSYRSGRERRRTPPDPDRVWLSLPSCFFSCFFGSWRMTLKRCLGEFGIDMRFSTIEIWSPRADGGLQNPQGGTEIRSVPEKIISTSFVASCASPQNFCIIACVHQKGHAAFSWR